MMQQKVPFKPFNWLVGLFLLFSLAISCKPEDEKLDPSPSKSVTFSSDTIMFDTVFTEQTTITQRLRLYNPNKKSISLSSVQMENPSSPFSITVNGKQGPITDVEVLGGDSIYILLKAVLAPNMQDTAFLTQDRLLVQVKGRSETQRVVVQAYGQDANYLDGITLPLGITTWDSPKPYFVYNNLVVPSGANLIIKPGVRVNSYKDNVFVINGTLTIQGSPFRPVRFSGNRIEPYYSTVPDQWGAIFLTDSAVGCQIDWAIIQNGFRGVQVGTPNGRNQVSLQIKNTAIRNMSDVGLYGFNANIIGSNLSISDCGQFNLAGLQGGTYAFAHITTAYSGNNPFNRRNPSVAFTTFFEDREAGRVYVAPLNLTLVNSIFTGNEEEEFVIANIAGGPTIDTLGRLRNNIFTSKANTYITKGNQSIFGSFRFHKPFEYNFHPDSVGESVAKKKGLNLNTLPSTDINLEDLKADLANKLRPEDTPTIGAYQQYY